MEKNERKIKTEQNNVYDVHCQQKLATPHTRDVEQTLLA